MHGSYQIQLWGPDCEAVSSGVLGLRLGCWHWSGGWKVDGLLVVWMLCKGPHRHGVLLKIWVWVFPSCFSLCSLCTRDGSPLTFQTCVIPKDCQTSDWSPWTPCSKTCRSTDLSPGYRLRSRMVTQVPIGGGKQCHALEEKEACNIIGDLLPNCPRYSPQRWSSLCKAQWQEFCECLIGWSRCLCIKPKASN